MAKKKTASRAAAQPAVKKKWSGHKTAAKSSARKTVKSKARGVAAAKSKPAKKARPKQRIADQPSPRGRFQGRRPAHLREVSRPRHRRTRRHGLAQAHVIRLQGPCNPAEVSKLHFHDVDFQMVYVLKGWVKTYMEGQGETLMKEGSAWTQPPRIKHLIMDYSDDVELLEVILPAEFKTVELTS